MNKKILSIVACALMAAGINATANEPQKNYVPEGGDFGVGVDLVPVIRTIGGAFNNEATPIGGKPFEYDMMFTKPDASILLKYMVNDSWAMKANLGLLVDNTQKSYYVSDDLATFIDPNSDKHVVDTHSHTSTGCTLMFGTEYRLGKRRVQGIFGAGILLGVSTDKNNYSYGNNITVTNREPSTAFPNNDVLPQGYRVTSRETEGPNFAAGIYGSIGAEWMVAPRIALGAEVDLYLYGAFAGKSVCKGEGYNTAYQRVEEYTKITSPGDCAFKFGTGNIGGSLYCIFYF